MRIACTAIAKRIMAGRVSKNGLDFIGEPKDVTSDCLKAIRDFIGEGNTQLVFCDGKIVFSISIITAEQIENGNYLTDCDIEEDG